MPHLLEMISTVFLGPDPAERRSGTSNGKVHAGKPSRPRGAAPAPLSCRCASKRYRDGAGERLVLREVTCDFQPGLTLIVGPSGSGKTTLLNLLAGLDEPTSGTIAVAGRPLRYDERSLAAHRRRCAVVFQDLNLVPHLTVRENVALPLLIAGESRADALREADQALEDVDARQLAARYPSQLSRGQRQRVAIGRASYANVMLADEPTASLDRESADQMMELLASLADQKKTIVVVSHDWELATRYANLVLECRDGLLTPVSIDPSRPEQETYAGPPTTLIEAPLSTSDRILPTGDMR